MMSVIKIRDIRPVYLGQAEPARPEACPETSQTPGHRGNCRAIRMARALIGRATAAG
jgi:hypothetical protein